MNAWPNLREWFQFGGTLALELAVVFAVAKLVALRLRSAQGRRALWQIAVLAMLLVTAGELNGVRGWMRWSEKKTPPAAQTKLVVTFMDVEPSFDLFHDAAETEAPASMVSPQHAPRPSRWQHHAVWPALIWAAGLALVLIRMVFAQVMTISLRLAGPRLTDAAVMECSQRLAQALGIRRNVLLLTSGRTVAPFTFGVGRPVIVLPRSFASAFTPEQQDAALAHELAHVAGFDSAWRCFSHFACAVLWWFPLVWLVRRELDHASELVADEASLLVANGPDRLAECLLACAKELRRPALAGWLGMDGGGFRSALGQRVARLLELPPHTRLSRPVPWYLRLLAPVVGVALLWIGMSVVLKSGEPCGAWRTSILGSAFATTAERPTSIAEERVRDAEARPKVLQAEPEWTQPVSTNNARPAQEQSTSATAMQTRIFHIDPNSFQQGMNSILAQFTTNLPSFDVPRGGQITNTNRFKTESLPAEIVIPSLRQWFKTMGVDLNAPNKAIFYNDRLGVLMVRATQADLDTMEKVLQFLNMSPPQLTISVKMFEVSRTDGGGRGLDWFLGTVLTNGLTRSNPPPAEAGNSLVTSGLRNAAPPGEKSPAITGILTDAQFRTVVRALEQQGGADLLSTPEVTTMSGRQAQIKVVDVRYIVTDLDIGANNPKSNQPEIQPIAEPFELGPVIDVIPYVQADGYTIQMTVTPSLKEFLGYDDPATVQPAIAGAAQSQGQTSPVPLPKFRLRQTTTTARIWDGQTLVIGAGNARDVKRSRDTNGITTTNYTDKSLFFFITVRLIDPAGNPIHPDKDAPFRRTN